MLKKTQVVMLPTKEKATKQIVKSRIYGESTGNPNGLLAILQEGDDKYNQWEGQHLYFLSDEEIKEGDWCIDLRPLKYGRLFKCTGFAKSIGYHGWIANDTVILDHKDQCKKIIATTDQSLK